MDQMENVIVRQSTLREVLAARLSATQLSWLDERANKISNGTLSDLSVGIGLASRKLGKGDLVLSSVEHARLDQLRSGFDPSNWSIDQAARVLLVLSSFTGDEEVFANNLDRLLKSAEISEQIALLLGLSLYPAQELLVFSAAEGVRSAMQPVFEAVAHRSPFPKERFSQAQWNQMVLKALFIGSRLTPIQGIDERRNPELAAILIDYAHERWAAGRAVSPELWRCVGPFARDRDLDDLARVLHSESDTEARAAALALSECALAGAEHVLQSAPALISDIRAKRFTWDSVQS